MRPFAPVRIASLCLPALSLANPAAKALANAEAQQYTNNAPFSGAVYIVNPNGQEVTAAGTNMCPDYASISCSNINHPSWCCPSSYTCASPPNSGGLIGCCPAGSQCGGNVPSVTTITVQAAQQTNVVYIQPAPEPTHEVVQQGGGGGGFCATLTMDGPGLPTTREGDCGTILIVNDAVPNLRAIGYGLGGVVIALHLVVGRMFHWI